MHLLDGVISMATVLMRLFIVRRSWATRMLAVILALVVPGTVWARNETESIAPTHARIAVDGGASGVITLRIDAGQAGAWSEMVVTLKPGLRRIISLPTRSTVLPPSVDRLLDSAALAEDRMARASTAQTLVSMAVNAAQPADIVGTVRVDAGNVRNGPGIESPIIGAVYLDDEVKFLGVSGDWYLVSLGDHTSSQSAISGGTGWVLNTLVNEPAQMPFRITTSSNTYAWQAATNTQFIYEQDGVLHLRVTEAQSSRANTSSVAGRTENAAPLEDISFTMTLEWAQGHGPGGSIFHTMLGDGRDLAMHVGPGEGYPWIEFTVDGQLLPGTGTGFPLYSPTPIQFTWQGDNVVVAVDGEERVRIPSAQPISSFQIDIDAQEGCIFHITLGDMTVVDAEP